MALLRLIWRKAKEEAGKMSSKYIIIVKGNDGAGLGKSADGTDKEKWVDLMCIFNEIRVIKELS